MKKTILIITLLCSIVSITNCTTNNKQNNQYVPPNPVNVMWQDISNWDSTTAAKVVHYNPDKFIINVDGPGSDSVNPNCGPHIKNIIPFIDTLVNVLGYKGVLVMHPDCSKGDYGHDWMGKGNLPNIDSLGTETYKVYVDYFKEINDSLTKSGLATFTELLLETEDSYICSSKSQFQKDFFKRVRSYVNDTTIKLSATSDWEADKYGDWGIDYYYVQMYDMGWEDKKLPTHLSGPNKYSTARVITLVIDMTEIMDSFNFPVTDKVCFTFTYAKGKCSHADAPMFGEDSTYWTESQFMEFITAFRNKTNCASVGIWHCESPFKEW
jgi:hypothetical protein